MPYSHVTRTAFGADAIAYARGDGTGHNGVETRNQYVVGVNMLPDGVIPFEHQMQPFWDKADPRHKTQINRFIVSFHPDELNPDKPEDLVKALDIGCRIARENAPDCQSAVYVQTDGVGHKVHLHILTNDVTMTDYKGLDSKAYAHFRFRQIVDRICEEYFDLKKAELLPERTNPAVRGARIKNEQIKAANALEFKQAMEEERIPDRTKIKSMKYIWHDDLRERIKIAAQGAVDESSFAQRLRLDGVELVSYKNKDGTFSYLHPATKKQPAHYTYELTDVSGFAGKIPPNLKSKSFKLGANYQPEGIAKLFLEQPQEQVQAEPIPVQVRLVPAAPAVPEAPPQKLVPVSGPAPEKSAKEIQKEHEQAELDRAKATAKAYVSPILHQRVPDANQETEDRIFDQFTRWRVVKRDQERKAGRKLPSIYGKDGQWNISVIFDTLKEQFTEFLVALLQDEAERQRQKVDTQRAAMAAELQRNVDYINTQARTRREDEEEHTGI